MINPLVAVFAIAASPSTAESCARSFDTVVERHLQAIDDRDLASYMSTIPPDSEDLMILPDGSVWKNRSEVESGHREWFADPSWTFDDQPVHRIREDQFGVVVQRVQIVRPDRTSPPFLLSMLFAPAADGCWYLRHDQNTLLPEAASE